MEVAGFIMRARRKQLRSESHQISLPSGYTIALPEIALTHGRTLWVLRQLGFGREAESTFNYYVKSLRKLGVPFTSDDSKTWTGRLAFYSYEHLVELSLALTLRTYGILPDAVLAGLVYYRPRLHAIYREAYAQRRRVTRISVYGMRARASYIEVPGVYLDLQIRFSGRQLVSFGPPRLVRPWIALQSFAETSVASKSILPVHISAIAEQIAELAARAPPIRRGRSERAASRPSNERNRVIRGFSRFRPTR